VDPGPADPLDLGLAVRHPVDPAVLAHIRDPAGLDRAARADLGPADQADLEDRAVLGRVGLAGPADIRDRADLADLAVLGRVGLADIRDLVARAGLDLAGRVDPVDQGMNRVDRADPADLADLADLVDLVGRAGRAIRADRHHPLTRPEGISTAVAPRWAARGISRTASAHPVTARRLRPHSADGVGMAGLHPERRRLGGMDRRLRVAGTVHHLPVVGTPHGTGRHAT
jgi:hypothetical protein